MPHDKWTCPVSKAHAIDQYFMEHRAMLIDIAAFLDRLERCQPDQSAAEPDFRMEAFNRALSVLGDGKPERAKRVLEVFSDPTDEPIARAGMKGATGAWDPKGAGA